MSKKQERELNPRLKILKPSDIRFVEEYLKNGGNMIRAIAAVKGYDLSDKNDYNRASVRADAVMKKVRITIAEEMEAQGITTPYLISVAKKGLEADKGIYDKNGNEINREKDYNVIHKFFDSCAKMKNMYPNQNIHIDVETKTGVVVVPGIFNDKDWDTQMKETRVKIEEMNDKE